MKPKFDSAYAISARQVRWIGWIFYGVCFVAILVVLAWATRAYLGTRQERCTVPEAFLAIRPAKSYVWTVINIETEEAFRSTDLCQAVQDAIRHTARLSRML